MNLKSLAAAAIGLVAMSAPTWASGVTYAVPQLGGIQIDGKADDWGRQGLHIDALAGANGRILPPATFDASVRLGWNDQGLLVLVRVVDPSISEDDNDAALYRKDSVELFLAPSTASKDIVQAVIAPGYDARHPTIRVHLYDSRQTVALLTTPASVHAQSSRTADGYIVEALIPWDDIGLKPTDGVTAAFQVNVNEDNGGDYAQLLWFPDGGASGDASKMQTITLGQSASPPIETAASARYERFRRTVVDVTGTAGTRGEPVIVDDGANVLATGTLDLHDGRAAARLALPMPAFGTTCGPLDVKVAGVTAAVLTLPDASKLRETTLDDQPLVFQPFVFIGPRFPSVDFAQPSLVEDLAGPYTIQTKFFDNQYRPVSAADAPGRYGAIVTVTPEHGKPLVRYITLFRAPEIDWKAPRSSFAGELQALYGVADPVARANDDSLADSVDRQVVRDLDADAGFARTTADLYETKETTLNARVRTDDDAWWYGLKKSLDPTVMYRYLVDLPAGYDSGDTTRRWPLVVFLHGSGERGDDLETVRAHGPPMLAAQGRSFPFILVSPQCPDREGWNSLELKDLIDQVTAKYRVDSHRTCMTGLSMGGFGTWNFAIDYPDMLAAIAPVCGIAEKEWVPRIKNVPVWAFHGEADPTVPFAQDKASVDALKRVGGNVRFTSYPGVGHDCWTRAYNTDGLYTWLMAQSTK